MRLAVPARRRADSVGDWPAGCHPERSEGSASRRRIVAGTRIPRSARDDNLPTHSGLAALARRHRLRPLHRRLPIRPVALEELTPGGLAAPGDALVALEPVPVF